MTTPYATLTDTVTATSVNFYMDPDWQPIIHEEGMKYFPLGLGHATKSTDGTKGVDGILEITTANDTDNAKVRTLLQSMNPMTLTMPNGDTYTIQWDPQQDRSGKAQFSLLLWQPVTTFTVYYYQAA